MTAGSPGFLNGRFNWVINVQFKMFITPDTFANGPYIIEPDTDKHRRLRYVRRWCHA